MSTPLTLVRWVPLIETQFVEGKVIEETIGKQCKLLNISIINKGYKDLRKLDELKNDILLFVVSSFNELNKSRTVRRFLKRKLEKYDKNKSVNFYYSVLSLSNANNISILIDKLLNTIGGIRFHKLCFMNKNKQTNKETFPLNYLKQLFNSYEKISIQEKEEVNIKRSIRVAKHLNSEIPTFTLAYGTATGNAKAISYEIAQLASIKDNQSNMNGCEVHGPMELNDLGTKSEFSSLPERRLLVIVISTTGDGELPETASRFWRKLRNQAKDKNNIRNCNNNNKNCYNNSKIEKSFKKCEGGWLKETHYAILGLGDSNYSQFNAAAFKLDKILYTLGAKKFYHNGLADDGTGLEDVVEPWKVGVIKEINRIWPNIVNHFMRTSPLAKPQVTNGIISPLKILINNHNNLTNKSNIGRSGSQFDLQKYKNEYLNNENNVNTISDLDTLNENSQLSTANRSLMYLIKSSKNSLSIPDYLENEESKEDIMVKNVSNNV